MKLNLGFQKKLTWGFSIIILIGLTTAAGIGYYFSSSIVQDMALENLSAHVKGLESVVETSSGDVSALQGKIKNLLRPKKLLQTGYFFILDTKGVFVLHPAKEGQNVLETPDLDGQFIFKEIIAKKSGYIKYRWLNAETKQPQNKIAVFQYYPQWDWYVAASLNLSEVQAPVRHLALVLFLVSFLVICVAIITTWAFGARVASTLTTISAHLSSASQRVNERSEELDKTSTGLANGALKQSSAIQETAAALEEIRSTVSKNLESTQSTIELSARVSRSAGEGQQIMSRLEDSVKMIMNESGQMKSAMEQGFSEIKQIVGVIADIEAKTQVINDIVFQTKLLSFNASVEAARAGEHGKGFSVVAEEVGRLAAMSGASAGEIRGALEQSRSKVESIVNAVQHRVTQIMNSTVQRVEEGVAIAKESNLSFENILQQVKASDESIQQIAMASKEQALGIEEIAKAIAQMEATTIQNSDAAQQTAGFSEGLKNDSREANEGVVELKRFLDPAAGQKEAA